MDEKAEGEEIARLKTMPALTELPHEENDYSDIIITWKKRGERRLVPESGAPVPVECGCGGFICSHITGMLPAVLRRAGHRRQGRTPDGAPARTSVTYKGKSYKLVRCLPGQRTAANRWYIHLRDAAREFGMEDDVMQPTLMKFKRGLYISLHVDDLVTEEKIKEVMEFLGDR